MTEEEAIKLNCLAYDTIDQREANNEKKEEIAGKVIDRIKLYKK